MESEFWKGMVVVNMILLVVFTTLLFVKPGQVRVKLACSAGLHTCLVGPGSDQPSNGLKVYVNWND